MQGCVKRIDVINKILENSGVVRYNAVKNRFKNEHESSPTLLHFYKTSEPKKEKEPLNAIDMYWTNMQKLRKKLEERRLKVSEIVVNGVLTRETKECNIVTDQEVTIEESSNGINVPLVTNTVIKNEIYINMLSSLNDFRYAIVSGPSYILKNRKKRKSVLKLEDNILTTIIMDKKEAQSVLSVDIAMCKLFLRVNNDKSFLSCMSKPARFVYLKKEINIVNLIAGNPTEIILKNTNTGIFTKECIKTLEFSIQDMYNTMIIYEITSPDDFIRWLLLIKARMHTVDKWSKDELLQSIRR